MCKHHVHLLTFLLPFHQGSLPIEKIEAYAKICYERRGVFFHKRWDSLTFSSKYSPPEWERSRAMPPPRRPRNFSARKNPRPLGYRNWMLLLKSVCGDPVIIAQVWIFNFFWMGLFTRPVAFRETPTLEQCWVFNQVWRSTQVKQIRSKM